MTSVKTKRRLIIEECPKGFYGVSDARNLRYVARRACMIANQQMQEAIALEYESGRFIAIGKFDSADTVRERIDRREVDAVRVRRDGSYMIVSRNLQRVGQEIIQLKKCLKQGEIIHLHWPDGTPFMRLASTTTLKRVWFEVGRELKVAQAE